MKTSIAKNEQPSNETIERKTYIYGWNKKIRSSWKSGWMYKTMMKNYDNTLWWMMFVVVRKCWDERALAGIQQKKCKNCHNLTPHRESSQKAIHTKFIIKWFDAWNKFCQKANEYDKFRCGMRHAMCDMNADVSVLLVWHNKCIMRTTGWKEGGCYLSNVTSVVQLLVACGPIISMHIIQLLTQHVCAFFIVFNDFDIEFLIISSITRIILVIRIDANHLFQPLMQIICFACFAC